MTTFEYSIIISHIIWSSCIYWKYFLRHTLLRWRPSFFILAIIGMKYISISSNVFPYSMNGQKIWWHFLLISGTIILLNTRKCRIFTLFIIVTGAVMFFIPFVFSENKITKLPGRENIMSSLNQIWRSSMRYLSLLWFSVLLLRDLRMLHVTKPTFRQLFYQTKIIPIFTFIKSVARP